MSDSKTSAERYIETRDARAVAAEEDRAVLFERLWAPIGAHVIELAGVSSGDTVVDIASGHGEPALLAARVVGPEGRVVGTDFDPVILEVARHRAADAGLTWAEFETHDAKNLEFPKGTFDVAISRLGLMFVDDIPKALKSIHRVLKPGGRFSVAVCGTEENNLSWCLVRDAVMQELGIEEPPAHELLDTSAFSLGDFDLLTRLLTDAGFTDVQVESDDGYVWPFESAEEIVEWHKFFLEASGLFDGQSADRKQAARDAAVARAREVADPDGGVRLTNQVMYAVGTRPE
ncbi:MAG TPA: class I SAM-dependent methyltransferase [Baekduia sp.]|nr:class I SAM-dependent methyltransferase [Baekduia sp.]